MKIMKCAKLGWTERQHSCTDNCPDNKPTQTTTLAAYTACLSVCLSVLPLCVYFFSFFVASLMGLVA